MVIVIAQSIVINGTDVMHLEIGKSCLGMEIDA